MNQETATTVSAAAGRAVRILWTATKSRPADQCDLDDLDMLQSIRQAAEARVLKALRWSHGRIYSQADAAEIVEGSLFASTAADAARDTVQAVFEFPKATIGPADRAHLPGCDPMQAMGCDCKQIIASERYLQEVRS